MRRTLLTLLMVSPLLALAGVPKQCQLEVSQSARLEQAQQAFRPGDPDEAVRLWDEVLDGSNDGPPCRTVEIVWRIGEFLKIQKEVSPGDGAALPQPRHRGPCEGLAGRGLVAGQGVQDDGALFPAPGRHGQCLQEPERGVAHLQHADGATTVREQTRAEMLLTGCPPPAMPSP